MKPPPPAHLSPTGLSTTPGASLTGLGVLECSNVQRAVFIQEVKLFSACCQAVVKDVESEGPGEPEGAPWMGRVGDRAQAVACAGSRPRRLHAGHAAPREPRGGRGARLSGRWPGAHGGHSCFRAPICSSPCFPMCGAVPDMEGAQLPTGAAGGWTGSHRASGPCLATARQPSPPVFQNEVHENRSPALHRSLQVIVGSCGGPRLGTKGRAQCLGMRAGSREIWLLQDPGPQQ